MTKLVNQIVNNIRKILFILYLIILISILKDIKTTTIRNCFPYRHNNFSLNLNNKLLIKYCSLIIYHLFLDHVNLFYTLNKCIKF